MRNRVRSIVHAGVCEGRGRRGYGEPYTGTQPETADTAKGIPTAATGPLLLGAFGWGGGFEWDGIWWRGAAAGVCFWPGRGPFGGRPGGKAAPRGGGAPPRGRGGTPEKREYLSEEQRSRRGCIARRMQPDFHHGLLGHVLTLIVILPLLVVGYRLRSDESRFYVFACFCVAAVFTMSAYAFQIIAPIPVRMVLAISFMAIIISGLMAPILQPH